MNIELKDSLFRFIVPPCLFWASFFSFTNIQVTSADVITDAFVVIVIFIASGFLIAALGTISCKVIDSFFKPAWKKKELEYWKKIALQGEYVQKKIERTWSFYSMNVNSLSALICSLLIIHFYFGFGAYIWLLLPISIFVILVTINYRKNASIAKSLMEG